MTKEVSIQKPKLSGKAKTPRTAEFPKIEKAVIRAVREYGETLKKLAKDD